MKKIYLFLLILITVLLLIGCSLFSGNSVKYGKDIANKIQILYKEKSQYLSDNSSKLFLWRQEVNSISKSKNCTIEKDEKGNWQYYKDDYQRISFKPKDESILKIIDMLNKDYEVLRIDITDDSIWYFISSDALIYSENDITNEDDSFTKHLKGNWYHFNFPYGT